MLFLLILLIILLIICVFILIGCIFGIIEWFEKVNNWKTLKQANEEYIDCLMLGWISGFGILFCGSIIAIIIVILKIII